MPDAEKCPEAVEADEVAPSQSNLHGLRAGVGIGRSGRWTDDCADERRRRLESTVAVRWRKCDAVVRKTVASDAPYRLSFGCGRITCKRAKHAHSGTAVSRQRFAGPRFAALCDEPVQWPCGGCQSSTLFPSGSMTQANVPYSESSVFSSTLQPSSFKTLTKAWRSSTR